MFCYSVLSSALERWIHLSQDSDIAALECRLTLLEVLKDIKTRQETMTEQLLFSCCLDDVEVSLISLNLAIMRIMKMAVMNFSENMESELWDMILCSMLDWLQVCICIYCFNFWSQMEFTVERALLWNAQSFLIFFLVVQTQNRLYQ